MSDLYTRNHVVNVLSNKNWGCNEAFPVNGTTVGRDSNWEPDQKCLEAINENWQDEGGNILGIGSSIPIGLSSEGKPHHAEMALFGKLDLVNYLEYVDEILVSSEAKQPPANPGKKKKRRSYTDGDTDGDTGSDTGGMNLVF